MGALAQQKKVVLKVSDSKAYGFKWVHFCYMSGDLYSRFFSVTGIEKSELGTYLSSWAEKDFNMQHVPVNTSDDVANLIAIINNHFAKQYTELYNNPTENPSIRGWVRMWLSGHMREEILARSDDLYEPNN